jgi:hypothetical protein
VDPGNLANNVWSTGLFRYDEKQKIFSSYVQGRGNRGDIQSKIDTIKL